MINEELQSYAEYSPPIHIIEFVWGGGFTFYSEQNVDAAITFIFWTQFALFAIDDCNL